MLPRVLIAAMLLPQIVSPETASAQVRLIEGTYRNPALGYSIQIPGGLKGITGDQSGPERGVKISLRSGGTITVFGEPNSLEWKTPEEGVDQELTLKDCNSADRNVKPALIGKHKGARGRLVCGDRVLILILAFRPRGGPIYWLRLDTSNAHESEDDAILQGIAASFRLIPWK